MQEFPPAAGSSCSDALAPLQAEGYTLERVIGEGGGGEVWAATTMARFDGMRH